MNIDKLIAKYKNLKEKQEDLELELQIYSKTIIEECNTQWFIENNVVVDTLDKTFFNHATLKDSYLIDLDLRYKVYVFVIKNVVYELKIPIKMLKISGINFGNDYVLVWNDNKIHIEQFTNFNSLQNFLLKLSEQL